MGYRTEYDRGIKTGTRRHPQNFEYSLPIHSGIQRKNEPQAHPWYGLHIRVASLALQVFRESKRVRRIYLCITHQFHRITDRVHRDEIWTCSLRQAKLQTLWHEIVSIPRHPMENLPKNTEVVPMLVLRDARTKVAIKVFHDLDELLEYLKNIQVYVTKHEKNP